MEADRTLGRVWSALFYFKRGAVALRNKGWKPQRCCMKGCRGTMLETNNPDFFRCSACGIGIWRDIKMPKVKDILEAGYSIQQHFGLNTREIKARMRKKGGKSSGRRKRSKKNYFVRKPLDL